MAGDISIKHPTMSSNKLVTAKITIGLSDIESIIPPIIVGTFS